MGFEPMVDSATDAEWKSWVAKRADLGGYAKQTGTENG
jgi:hypothetical protein